MRRMRFDESEESYLAEMQRDGIVAWAVMLPLLMGIIVLADWLLGAI